MTPEERAKELDAIWEELYFGEGQDDGEEPQSCAEDNAACPPASA